MEGKKRWERGVTLVELMIVVTLLSMVVAAMYNMFTFQQHSYSVQDNVAVMQQNLRVALEYIVKEVRMAGYIPEGIPPNNSPPANDSVMSAPFTQDGESEAIDEASLNSITLEADLDDDDKTEMVRYALSYDATRNSTNLTREVWEWEGSGWSTSTGSQTLVDSIDSLTLSYSLLADNQGLDDDVDNDGDGYTDEEGELKLWDFATDGLLTTNALRGCIRKVTVTVVARTPAPDRRYNNSQGDHYRRKTLSSTVALRNLK